ncbi:MAG: metal ABC transporter permease [Defluviitaleaceae bacterium]|nr:metal ABC transporter permease [Defluviitaleaceae bacterium]
MVERISFMLSFSFMQRALIVGLVVSVCASLLGVSLVLKRYAMIGTGLSHVGYAALVGATALGFAPLAVSMPVVVGAAFLLLRLNENSKIKGDSAIALISASSFAVGVIIVSQTTGLNTHVCNAMFGSILAMTRMDLMLSVGLSIAVIVMFVLFYKQIFAVTYDETFALATGTRANAYKSLIAFLTAVTVVLGMRMMGALLIASLIIFPAITAMRLCKSFLSVVIVSVIVAVFCFFVGMMISFELDWPTGASVVSVNLVLFIIFSAAQFIKNRVGVA